MCNLADSLKCHLDWITTLRNHPWLKEESQITVWNNSASWHKRPVISKKAEIPNNEGAGGTRTVPGL